MIVWVTIESCAQLSGEGPQRISTDEDSKQLFYFGLYGLGHIGVTTTRGGQYAFLINNSIFIFFQTRKDWKSRSTFKPSGKYYWFYQIPSSGHPQEILPAACDTRNQFPKPGQHNYLYLSHSKNEKNVPASTEEHGQAPKRRRAMLKRVDFFPTSRLASGQGASSKLERWVVYAFI
jgi:hypothetical protein